MMLAAWMGRLECVSLLIANNAKVHSFNAVRMELCIFKTVGLLQVCMQVGVNDMDMLLS